MSLAAYLKYWLVIEKIKYHTRWSIIYQKRNVRMRLVCGMSKINVILIIMHRIVDELKSQGINNAEDASHAISLEEELKKRLE